MNNEEDDDETNLIERSSNTVHGRRHYGSTSKNNAKIKTYALRWFILLVICLINISNAINGICYSAIADFTGKFYDISYTKVNFLSLIYFIVTIPAGFASVLVIDYFGVRSSLNLAGWLNFAGAAIRTLSAIRESDGNQLIPASYKYFVLMFGQTVCSLAQPFVMFVTTKFANEWFTENQRALANAVALISNTFGILIGAFISPLIVKSEQNYIYQMSVLNYITCSVSLLPAILSAFIRRSKPPTPPSYSSMSSNNSSEATSSVNNSDSQVTLRQSLSIYFTQVGKLLKSTQFLLLMISFGIGLGLFNSLMTLLQQILCIRGYSDQDVGIFGGIMIFSGVTCSLIAGIIVDRTKRFEVVAKICFCVSCMATIFNTILQTFDNDHGVVRYLIIVSFILIGSFGVPLLPICLEMAVECVYPIPEATATGIVFIGGQFSGIIAILGLPKLGSEISKESYTYTSIQTCISANSTSITSTLNVVDFKYPLYGQTAIFCIIAITFTIFFKCPYLRLRHEREQLAKQILNS